VRISSDGSVGIGTTTPLHDINSGPVVEIKGTTTNRIGGLILRSSNDTVDARFRAFNGVVYIGAESSNDLILRTNGADRITVKSDGVITQGNSTSGSGAIVGEQTFRLAANVTAFGATIGDFFGATSAISLEASSVYEIIIYAVFLKTTAGTATWTLTASSAPTRIAGTNFSSPAAGIGSGGVGVANFAGSQGGTTATFPVSSSLTTGVNHVFQFTVQVQTNLATSFKLQLTQSAGTATPLAGSYYTVKKISATTGTFV
jgi:hypothetical protein